MPKWLKFILNCCAVVTGLGYLFVLGMYFLSWIMGWRTTESGLWLIALIPLALHRIPIMVGEFLFVRLYLNGKNAIKELCKINIYVVFSLFLSSIICAGIFLRQVDRWIPLVERQYLLWGVIALITSLVAIAEVYIKTDFFKEKHLTNHPKKVTQLMSVIIIPVYILWVAGWVFYVYMKNPVFWSLG